MVPAISCLFFHFFWELSRVVDSEASPGDLQALRSRAALLLSLCQSCLSEPEPDLRETALQALQELLLLLGPGLPQARLRLRPEPALEAQLGLALLDLVFQPRPRGEPRGPRGSVGGDPGWGIRDGIDGGIDGRINGGIDDGIDGGLMMGSMGDP
ncbi:cohesin subunit SA-3-like [Anomalospiza imberbis]|uniref:cohesin subunit SA-3-like n=1 Tax=Anomalospiza imberbis TaxID=187417 RepID=UPI00359010F2